MTDALKQARDALYMVFDVESIGLHGEGFAVAWVVVNRSGERLDEGCLACDPDLCDGADESRLWVAENVPPITVTSPTKQHLRNAFWHAWRHWAERGAVLVADCAWPVEAGFLSACVRLNHGEREWQGPYPLHDLASVLMACGADPLRASERLPDELPAHHPLNDARQSARQLVAAIARADAAQATPVALKETLMQVLADGLRGTYHCHRVWHAWGVGTMGEDDFSPVEESDTPAELADAVLALLAAAPPAPAAQPLTECNDNDSPWLVRKPCAAAGKCARAAVTEAMVTAYLTANDAYWKRVDAEPTKLGKWRNGTPSEATRVSLAAALQAAQQEPAKADAREALTESKAMLIYMDFDRRADRSWTSAEYLLKFAVYVSERIGQAKPAGGAL